MAWAKKSKGSQSAWLSQEEGGDLSRCERREAVRSVWRRFRSDGVTEPREIEAILPGGGERRVGVGVSLVVDEKLWVWM